MTHPSLFMLRVTALLHCLLLLLFIGSSSIAIAAEDPTTLETTLRNLIEETEEPMNSSLNPTFLPSVNSTTSTSIEQRIETSSSNFQGRSVTPVNGDSQHEGLAGLQPPQQNTDNNQSSLLPTIFKQKYIFGSDLLPMQIGKEGELKKMKDSYAAQQELAKTSSPELFEAYKSACAILDIAESYQTGALLKASEKYQELSTKEQSITKSVFFLHNLHCSDGQGETLNRNITKLLSAANSVVELTKEGIRVDQLIASARALNGIPGREESINNFETVMQQTRNAIEAYKAFANAVKAGSTEEARLMFEHGSDFKSSAHDQKISFLTTEAATFKNHYDMLSWQARTAGNTAQAAIFKNSSQCVYITERGLQEALTARAEGHEELAQACELSAQYYMQAAWARAEGTETGLERAKNFEKVATDAYLARITFMEALTARTEGHEEVAQVCELYAQYYMQAAWAHAEGTMASLARAVSFREAVLWAFAAEGIFKKTLLIRALGHAKAAQSGEFSARCLMEMSQIFARKAPEDFPTQKDIEEFCGNWGFTTAANYEQAVELVQTRGSDDQIQALLQAAQYRSLATQAYVQGDEKNLLKAEGLKKGAMIANEAATIFGEAHNLSKEPNGLATNAFQVKSLIDRAKDMLEEARAYAEQEKEIEDENDVIKKKNKL